MKLSKSDVTSVVFCVCTLSGTALSITAQAAESWNVGFQPHIEVGLADYTLDFSATSQFISGQAISTGKLSFNDTMPTVSAGLTMFADRFFLDLAVQRMESYNQNLSDSHTINSTGVSTITQSFTTVRESYDSDDFTRDEYTLSLGYGITDSFSVYAGYKKQYTEFNNLIGTGAGTLQFLSGSPDSNPQPVNFDSFADIKFDYDGPFVGATTGWQLNEGALQGRLTVSAAVAMMDGSLKAENDSASLTLNSGIQLPLTVSLSDILNTEGDAVGITLGATWIGQTSIEDLSYSVGVNGYQYDFSADVDGRPEVNETVVQLKIGLAYAF